jgi:predicted RNase H-like nuclease (RuvC/YqgF family)
MSTEQRKIEALQVDLEESQQQVRALKDSIENTAQIAQAVDDENAKLEAERDALLEVQEDKHRLCREIDEILSGKAGMAKQASLCDLVGPIRDVKARQDQLAACLRDALLHRNAWEENATKLLAALDTKGK